MKTTLIFALVTLMFTGCVAGSKYDPRNNSRPVSNNYHETEHTGHDQLNDWRVSLSTNFNSYGGNDIEDMIEFDGIPVASILAAEGWSFDVEEKTGFSLGVDKKVKGAAFGVNMEWNKADVDINHPGTWPYPPVKLSAGEYSSASVIFSAKGYPFEIWEEKAGNWPQALQPYGMLGLGYTISTFSSDVISDGYDAIKFDDTNESGVTIKYGIGTEYRFDNNIFLDTHVAGYSVSDPSIQGGTFSFGIGYKF